MASRPYTITEKQKEFIRQHSATMLMKEISRRLGMPKHRVYKFVDQEKLPKKMSQKRTRKYKAPEPVAEPEQPRARPVERRPQQPPYEFHKPAFCFQ